MLFYVYIKAIIMKNTIVWNIVLFRIKEKFKCKYVLKS